MPSNTLAGALSLGEPLGIGSVPGGIGHLQTVPMHQGAIGHEGLGGTIGDDAATVEQDRALAQGPGEVHVVGGDDEGHGEP